MILLINNGAGAFNPVIRILLDYLEKAEELTKLYDNCHGLWTLHSCLISYLQALERYINAKP
jgi:hypothetical protein